MGRFGPDIIPDSGETYLLCGPTGAMLRREAPVARGLPGQVTPSLAATPQSRSPDSVRCIRNRVGRRLLWPNPLVATVDHDRMPVLLATEYDDEAWLNGSVKEALALVKPFPPERMSIVQTGYRDRFVGDSTTAIRCPALTLSPGRADKWVMRAVYGAAMVTDSRVNLRGFQEPGETVFLRKTVGD
jgi:hypothetical protein